MDDKKEEKKALSFEELVLLSLILMEQIKRATAADENQKFPISVNYYFMILSRHYDILSKKKDEFTLIVNKFFYSTILLPVGYQKERMLNFAIQNDSLNIFEYKAFLEKLYFSFLYFKQTYLSISIY